jgi:hypothetical protein
MDDIEAIKRLKARSSKLTRLRTDLTQAPGQ